MRSGQKRVGLLGAAGGVGFLAAAAGCLSVDWPPTVESGNVGGSVAGGSTTAAPDAAVTPGDADEGDTSAGQPVSAGETCMVTEEAICLDYKAVSATNPTTCPGTLGATGSTCPSTSLIGCCTATTNGTTIETCNYSGVAATLLTECGTMNGTWTTSP